MAKKKSKKVSVSQVAKKLTGKKVPKKYQKVFGKKYSGKDAKRIAVKAMQIAKKKTKRKK